MTKRLPLIVMLSLATVFATLQATSVQAATAKQLIWRQEFNGKAYIKPDAAIWGYDLGGQNANNEEQLYTNSKYNVAMDGRGILVIELHTDASAPAGVFAIDSRAASAVEFAAAGDGVIDLELGRKIAATTDQPLLALAMLVQCPSMVTR